MKGSGSAKRMLYRRQQLKTARVQIKSPHRARKVLMYLVDVEGVSVSVA